MADSFYWYDLETTGVNPKWDRIVQFAGFRTDADLNPIGDEYCTYINLPDDVLPNPGATLVTGITPELLAREGIKESAALAKINQLFFCAGYLCAGL
jgi:exodeoxyribonuclease-1